MRGESTPRTNQGAAGRRRRPDLTLLLGLAVLLVASALAFAQNRASAPPDPTATPPATQRPTGEPSSAAPTTPSAPSTPSGTAAAATRQAPTPPPVARLRFVGDVMLARSIGRRIAGGDPAAIFDGVAMELRDADVTVVNLECAISAGGTPARKRYTFRAPPAAAATLADAGVDLAAVANNHAFDYGEAAFLDTLTALAAESIGALGGGGSAAEAHAGAVVAAGGLRIAFLAYAADFTEGSGWRTTDAEATSSGPGIAIGRPEAVRDDVRRALDAADVAVVLMHAGVEGSVAPAADQRRIARAALDAGASLVVGSHPHVLQGAWHAGGSAVAWSLGNFVFDGFEGFYGGRATDSAILDVTLDGRGVARLEWLPVILVDGLPEVAPQAEAARIRRQLAHTDAP